jgi:glycosyltransferase involved in cell wall biosynthesis
MVILEALTLGVPVLSTRFSSSEEIIQNKGYGIICDNSEESITKSLVSILNNPNILKTMKEAAVEYGYDNQTILSQVRKLI